ncbi:cytochrome P450 [Micromonospora sp. NPDC051196]|uniref:cytochrome P450 n=1 Tax=Micromonospora sp. NPDC051196 TaxID=3155281 RepID=UPI0034449661
MSGLPAVGHALLLDPSTRDDPSLYRRLHTEAPVLRTAGLWLVSGYQQVSRLAGDPRLVIDPRAGDPPLPLTQSERLELIFGRMLSFRDGTAHRRLRQLVSGAFSARRTNALDRTVRDLVADLISQATADGAEFDVVPAIAERLPVLTSCRLLDLPTESWSRVDRWARTLTGQLFRFGQTADQLADMHRQVDEMLRFIDELAAARRDRTGDLVAELLGASCGTDPRLSHDEFVSFVALLFINGLETVTAAVSTCVAALLRQPGLAAELRREPDRALDVVDECLRLESPVWLAARRAVEPIEVDGQVIEANDPVFLLWAVANRDPAVFDRPDEFRPGRAGRHLAFGRGPHHCLGAAMARVQAAEVLRQLAAYEGLRAGSGPTRRRHTAALLTYDSLPVTVTPAGEPLSIRAEARLHATNR